ncbi:Bax inhibitor-1/YccA family protein [Escherichia fergusonii]|uniref:Bax inhibitor-1/YccA family protein n=1 Tax=Escherichia fergusonii TaxID=564 RepID=UPI000F676336|nr:Bax inhibitor-1 family protein [Escherichia fergusonii]EHG6159427.1 permease [Escherichia fergusonii]EHK3065801.1 Bax inhibitor-1/YccA family protein [Escherichia fergusonii]EHK3070573.1 Bax inhibitor-1/YccA family protein [Escherichia fergusonii]EJB0946489.1 Bax inhibitor-1/YccA family protein [Escherichia fergusonii]QMC75883.1 Bax inhibitor-1 family protein [Escherichia fergusonii]
MSFKPSFEGVQPVVMTDRATFIRRAYMHLAGAVVGFIILSALFIFSGPGKMMLRVLMNSGQFGWLVVLGAFILVSMLATRLADNVESNQTQLIGLGIYVLAEALIFAPLLTLAAYINPAIIGAAGITTALLVGGLTFTAFTTKKDFSFMRSFLTMAGFIAFGAIIASIFMGFSLGVWFSAAMVLLCAGFVLYDTSNIIHHYPTDRPAGAALHLFASIATMFWYVLRIFMSRD